jgi:DNA-binding NarL/FixJ family response regulator
MDTPTRVLVADDHDLFRVGLATALAGHEDFEVVGQASGGKMAVRLASEVRPDAVLMDLRMPDLGGVEAIEAILRHDPSTRIVVLTVSSEETDVVAAVDAGACGYLIKDSPIDDVIAAVTAAVSGTAWLSPRAAQALLDRTKREHASQGPPPAPLDAELSPRELEVLQLVAQGLDNSEIATELYISPRTVKNHVSSILGKLGVPNRVQAAVYAFRRGLT